MSSATGLRLAFYGDDFTGSTDALEVIAFAGYRCALFLKPPTRSMLESFPDLDVIGIAGDSRGMSPDEMDSHLPQVFDAMGALGAPIIHYKVCSTFDSSPEIGSIGRAMTIARKSFPVTVIPIVAGTPALGRYCSFGNLFARYNGDGEVYRIDRHPVMSVHPVTPMKEANLAVHLSKQAALSIGIFAVPDLEANRDCTVEKLQSIIGLDKSAVLLDAVSPRHLTRIGGLLTNWSRNESSLFVVGSSGVEYALTQWWSEAEDSRAAAKSYDSFGAVDRVLAVSGSASKLTALQISGAIKAGFADIAVNARELVDDDRWPQARADLARRAVGMLESGRSVILHTARGPDDARIEEMIEAVRLHGHSRDHAVRVGGRTLGTRLGFVVRDILNRVPLRRLLLSGGDTSSQITQVLEPDALEVAARLAPGVPLCRTLSRQPGNAIEIALKGGQLGGEDFFETARRGH